MLARRTPSVNASHRQLLLHTRATHNPSPMWLALPAGTRIPRWVLTVSAPLHLRGPASLPSRLRAAAQVAQDMAPFLETPSRSPVFQNQGVSVSAWHFPAKGRLHGLAGPPTPGYRGTRLLPQLWMRSTWPPTSQPHLQPVHIHPGVRTSSSALSGGLPY